MARFCEVRTFTAAAAVLAKRLVKISGAGVAHSTAAATDDPVGVAEVNTDSDNPASVRLLSTDDTLEITASGAFAFGEKVYADDDGKVQALPAAAGTYRQVGIAMEAATADGDIVEILPYGFNLTHTVS